MDEINAAILVFIYNYRLLHNKYPLYSEISNGIYICKTTTQERTKQLERFGYLIRPGGGYKRKLKITNKGRSWLKANCKESLLMWSQIQLQKSERAEK